MKFGVDVDANVLVLEAHATDFVLSTFGKISFHRLSCRRNRPWVSVFYKLAEFSERLGFHYVKECTSSGCRLGSWKC